MSSLIVRFLNPRKYRRDCERQRVETLRQRDGETCRRCRRPIRFDLPIGHDKGPRIEPLGQVANGELVSDAQVCLIHGRCNAAGADHTEQVMERLRPKREAELMSKARKSRRARAR